MITRTKIRFRCWLLLFFALLTGTAEAQNVSVYALVDSSSILIGDQIRYHLKLNKPKTLKVNFPEYKDSIISNIEVLESYPVDTVTVNSSQITLEKSYLITSFDSANYIIPPAALTIIHDSVSGPDTLFSNPVSLYVQSIPVDTTKMAIYDIKEPYQASLSFWDFIYLIKYYLIAFYVLTFLVLVFFIIVRPFLLVNREGEKIKLFQKPQDPPHVIALRELDKLKNEKLWQKGKVKDYHSRISEIIRTYIEDRFKVMAMEQTSSEIMHDIREYISDYDTKVYKSLENVLTLSDFVKFAKYNPLPDENDTSLKNAYYIVKETFAVKQANQDEVQDKELEMKEYNTENQAEKLLEDKENV